MVGGGWVSEWWVVVDEWSLGEGRVADRVDEW